MGWKIILSVLFILIAVGSLLFYWFIPFRNVEFSGFNENSNFSLTNSKDMQFYNNLRFSDSSISYRIDNCPLKRKNDMEQAFILVSNKTILDFYPVDYNENILVRCDDKIRMDEQGLFIAGEGGPVNITSSGSFNVISYGEILLIKDSDCYWPNIAVHELLHVLGFYHSNNPQSIMYNISNCGQIIGDDIINTIDDLYIIPSESDLSFANVSAKLNGRYLYTDFIVRNNGLKKSSKAEIIIYSDNSVLKRIELPSLDIGMGLKMGLKNLWVSVNNLNTLKFYLNSSFNEIDKQNNELILEVSK